MAQARCSSTWPPEAGRRKSWPPWRSTLPGCRRRSKDRRSPARARARPRRGGSPRGGPPPAGFPAGSDGLWFLPYLTGERSPHADPLARGAFVGLTLAHDRRHLTRAVLEGVAFCLRDGLDLMIGAGMPAPDQIRASGGGTASPLWRQILADVLGAEMPPVNTSGGAPS